MPSLYVLAAAPFEFAPLEAFLEETRPSPRDPYRDICFKALGVGPIEAAVQAANLRDPLKESDVLVVGTAGSSSPVPPYSLYAASQTIWCPPCYRVGMADLVRLEPPMQIDRFGPLEVLPYAPVLASPTITVKPAWDATRYMAVCDQLGHTSQEKSLFWLENLELQSISRALGGNVRQLGAILAVTNTCGPSARIEWKTNFLEASIRTAKFLGPWLRGTPLHQTESLAIV